MYSLRHYRITMGWRKSIPEKHRFRTLAVRAYRYQPPHLEHPSGLVERIPLRPREAFSPRADSAAAADRNDDQAGKGDSPSAADAASAKGAHPGPPGRRSAGSRARNMEQIRSGSDIRKPPCRPYHLPVRVLQDELRGAFRNATDELASHPKRRRPPRCSIRPRTGRGAEACSALRQCRGRTTRERDSPPWQKHRGCRA